MAAFLNDKIGTHHHVVANDSITFNTSIDTYTAVIAKPHFIAFAERNTTLNIYILSAVLKYMATTKRTHTFGDPPPG